MISGAAATSAANFRAARDSPRRRNAARWARLPVTALPVARWDFVLLAVKPGKRQITTAERHHCRRLLTCLPTTPALPGFRHI